jgi:pantoate kinase
MTSSIKAFAPGNISCIFKIHEDQNPEKMGSLGLGFTVNKGVIVEVAFSDKNEILLNNKNIDFPTVKNVVNKLAPKQNIKIKIDSELPLGSGFGISGASALATAYALNKLLNLNLENLQLAKIAHVAEVENRTGLGDVVNQYYGGFFLREVPSSEFKVEKILLDDITMYCKYFSELSTKEVISNEKMKQSINESASEALQEINKLEKNSITFSDLITISKKFAQKSGLLMDEKVISTIKEIEKNGGHASMIMLGNAVFSDIPFNESLEIRLANIPTKLL